MKIYIMMFSPQTFLTRKSLRLSVLNTFKNNELPVANWGLNCGLQSPGRQKILVRPSWLPPPCLATPGRQPRHLPLVKTRSRWPTLQAYWSSEYSAKYTLPHCVYFQTLNFYNGNCICRILVWIFFWNPILLHLPITLVSLFASILDKHYYWVSSRIKVTVIKHISYMLWPLE